MQTTTNPLIAAVASLSGEMIAVEPQSPSSSSSSEAFNSDVHNETTFEIEAVIACLGDDAAVLREENSECEIAANMERAAELLSAFSAATPPSLPIDFKQASEQGGWIRVDERLPEIGPDEEGIHVWTWDGVTVEHDEFVANYEQPAGPTVGGWVRTDDWFAGDIDNRVTHWQLYSKPASPSPHPEDEALLLGGDEGGKAGGQS